MAFRTQDGKHYHIIEGCCGAHIPCTETDGLAPCGTCCRSASDAVGTQANPDASGSYSVPDIESNELVEQYRNITGKLSSLMEDYKYTDSDRFLNEMTDYFHGRMFGTAVPNSNKHGWDAFLIDDDSNVHPFESKVSSVYGLRYGPDTKSAGKMKVPSATFNDTTDAKLNEFSKSGSLISLGVRKGTNDIAFSVVLPANALVPHLREKMQEHEAGYESGKYKSSRSSQTVTMLQMLKHGGQIVANAPKEEIAQYLKALGSNYAKYADSIITADEWKRQHGFTRTGENEDGTVSRRCQIAMARYHSANGEQAIRTGMTAPEEPFDAALVQRATEMANGKQVIRTGMTVLEKPFDAAFVQRAKEINAELAQFMHKYHYDDADRLHNDIGDHMLAQRIGVVAQANHGKHAWDAALRGTDGAPVMMESKISASFGAKRQVHHEDGTVSEAWKDISATFNDTTNEKIAEFKKPNGMLVLGCRTRMDECQFAVCLPTAKVAEKIEPKMKQQQAEKKRTTQKLSMNQLLDMGADVVILGDKETVLRQMKAQLSATLYKKYERHIIPLNEWQRKHGIQSSPLA